jgi:hypothetical protein
VFPAVEEALRRDPAALAAGEWWRLLSPLLVRVDSWVVLAIILAGTLIVGIPVERSLGSARLVALYLAGGLVGEVAGYEWEPHGPGSSIARCGLMGGLAVAQLVGRMGLALVSSVFTLYLVAALVGIALGGLAPLVVLLVLVGVAFGVVMQRAERAAWVARLVMVVVVAGGVALAVMRDLHGPALLAGVGIGALLEWVELRGRRGGA